MRRNDVGEDMEKRERLITAIFTAVFLGFFSRDDSAPASRGFVSCGAFCSSMYDDPGARQSVSARRLKPYFYGGGE